MKLMKVIVISIALVMALSSCDGAASVSTDANASGGQTTSSPAAPTSTTTAANLLTTTIGNTKAPQIYFPDELLTAEEASTFVGQTVTLIPGSDEVPESGELVAEYTYDFPTGTTSFAFLYLTQNALISEAELKNGHDAKWAFNEFKKFSGTEAIVIPNLGLEAFYFERNMDVHCLFQDYYILVAFPMDADDAASLSVNKAIAKHVIDELSLAPLN